METLILSWYVLIETDSALWLAMVGALRFGGTLISPMVGVMADRISRRQAMVWMRCVLSVLALAIVVGDSAGLMGPVFVLVIAGLSGLLRPAEHLIRSALIADTVPDTLLSNAVGFSRTTSDSARIFGSLAGAGLLATIGLGMAYSVITAMYISAVLLTLGIAKQRPAVHTAPCAPWSELKSGFAYVRSERVIMVTLFLALLANLTAFPLTHGLLPVFARDVYGLDEVGLASMLALTATGALAGSLLVAVLMRSRAAEPFMIWGLVVWHLLVILFVLLPPSTFGWVVLAGVGVASSAAMTTMAVSLLYHTAPAFRGRIMGVRMLAVYGLPVGLLLAGVLIEQFGVVATLATYGTVGLVPSIWVAVRWKHMTT
jgi:Na+/melibiose symporter-like transporter